MSLYKFLCFGGLFIGQLGAPGHPVVREQAGNAVHLEWLPPHTIDSNLILGYTLEYVENGEQTILKMAINPVLMVTHPNQMILSVSQTNINYSCGLSNSTIEYS